MIQGADISYCQPRSCDYAQLAKAGVAFSWIKCTDAVLKNGAWVPFVDALHEAHAVGLRAAGVPTGSYCFGHTSYDPLTVADHFVANAFFDQLRPVIDMETLKDGHIPGDAGPWCLQWLKRVEANSGVKPIIYASTYYLKTMLAECPELANYDVWIAEYHASSDHPPKMPVGWSQEKMLVWQWTGSGTLPGCPTQIDRDVLIAAELSAIMVG